MSVAQDHLNEIRTNVVRADFQSLVASHHEPDFLAFLMRQETDIASSTFLPLGGVPIESEQFGTPGTARSQVG
jgi:hypothetical protein